MLLLLLFGLYQLAMTVTVKSLIHQEIFHGKKQESKFGGDQAMECQIL